MRKPIITLFVMATACARPVPKPTTGSVGGDIYLVMASGDTKKIAGNAVYLLPYSDSLLSGIGALCHAASRLFNRAEALSVNTGDLGQTYLQILTAHETDSMAAYVIDKASRKAPTGVNATYSFDSLPAGRYLLAAQTAIGDNSYFWIRFFRAQVGHHQVLDLDNQSIWDLHGCAFQGLSEIVRKDS